MKRILLVAVTCLLSGHAVGEAQRPDPGYRTFPRTRFGAFADTGQIGCLSWNCGQMDIQKKQ